MSDRLVIRARTLVSMAGEAPARGEQLFAPLRKLDDAALVLVDGRVEEAESWKRCSPPPGAEVRDLGDVCLAPAVVNAHCHVQLSHLAGKTRWGAGFTAWLESLIAHLREPLSAEAITEACEDMAARGTGHVGDFAGEGLSLVDDAARRAGLGITHFCEWFGMDAPFIDAVRPWPPRCRAALEQDEERPVSDISVPLEARCVPAGHALYSTAPEVLRDARQWCAAKGRVFALHLAESPEETELLLSGSGPLAELYQGIVLPDDWQAPGMRPLALAMKLGLMGAGTLAVHGVQLDAQEMTVLAASGAALCLCPRSNSHLGVGEAPFLSAVENNVLCCLGTDGLSSNTDLDVRKEAVFLRETCDAPPEALLRLLTVNAAEALRLPCTGRLEPGQPGSFCVLPEALSF